MRTLTLFVPIMPPSTNSIYAGMHWTKRKKQADDAHSAIAHLVKLSKESPFERPVQISMTPSLGKGCRSRDVSNYSYAAKLIEDGLVGAGLLAGDEADKVRRWTLNAPVVDRDSPSGFFVEISELEDAA